MHSFLKKGKTKKPLHRHQESAGALLSLQNDVLCNGFEIQRRDCCRTHSLANSTKTHRVVGDGIFSQHTAGIGWLCHISILHRIQLQSLIREILLYTIELIFVNKFSDGFEYLSELVGILLSLGISKGTAEAMPF